MTTGNQQQDSAPSRQLVVRAALCFALLCCLIAPARSMAAEWSVPTDETLLEMRAARRDGLRERSLNIEKDGQPPLFGLLVVPVAFADTPFPADWNPQSNLSPVLTGDSDPTLSHYFSVASGQKLGLRITLAPIVHLPQERRQYSDIGSTNFLRTRMMATEALEILRDLGLEFRRLDMDGPDGLPASGDDDGQVDGVLFLHAGIGLENDMDTGLIPPHQYFLTEPVFSGGVGASFYAVASYRSGLGIWAHETAHLLGMEDRYDPRLQPAGGSEIQSRGGLGRFSLMSSGAWGTGQGRGPALPDAYNCLQLGWVKVRELDGFGGAAQLIRPGLASGEVGRIWTNGQPGTEFFLVETRNPAATAPYDAAVPGDQLLIYHVDESLPEGYLIEEPDGQWHLRVRLVEADGDESLADGLDDGGPGDLFPGSGAHTSFGPVTIPDSDGYGGPSGVSLSAIHAVDGGVSLVSQSTRDFAVDCTLTWSTDNPATMDLSVRQWGEPFSRLSASLRVDEAPAWGAFQSGGLSTTIDLVESSPGVWTPAEAVHWVPDTERPEGATTRFTIQLIDPAWDSGPLERPWVWSPGNQSLDFAQLWPGQWVPRRPGISPKTGWFRWDSEPWLTATQTPVLACVDTIFPDSSEWPDVRYNNYAYATLTSGPLDSSVRGVRLIHAVEGDLLTGAVGRDGGQVVWVAPDGSEHPVEPVDGWQAQVHAQVYTPQSGQGVLVGTTPFLRDGLPVWHTDVFPVPADSSGIKGENEPWRLRLVFGSDQSRYYRGWFIASIEPLFDAPPASALAVDWNSELTWDWPAPLPAPPSFLIEEYLPAAEDWVTVIETSPFADPLGDGYRLSRSEVLDRLQEKGRNRTRIRIVGGGPFGVMASRPLVIYPDGGPAAPALLGVPWPNPSHDGTVRFLAEIPAEQEARVTVYDLRGRLIQSWALPSGNHFLLWEGSDSSGRRVASGTYLLRLEGSGAVISRKVVLLH